MPKSRKHREYRFEIDAFSPMSIPMSRLAEYISDLANTAVAMTLLSVHN
jgi:hypothetical protein